MYERFTDRARKVMQLANQEALRLRHEYIGTEHVLFGLAKEGTGVAANALKNLAVDLRTIRSEIERVVVAGREGEQVVMGRLPHTPRTRKVIDYSIDEARNLNCSYVGTEHLLLGLLREQEGVAAQILTHLGITLVGVREEVLNLLGKLRPVETPAPPRTPAPPVLPGLSQADAIDLLRAERAYQDAKWADNPHPVGEWLLVVQIKAQEAAVAWQKGPGREGDDAAVLKLVQVAAVAVACLEEHGGPLVLEWLASLDRVRANPGYLTAGKRLEAWTPFLDAIRGRCESLHRAAEERAAADAAKVAEFMRRHPGEDL